MARIMFVREQWADGNPDLGESDGNYMISTARRLGHEVEVFHYDDAAAALPLDDRLVIACLKFQPEVVLFSHLISWGDRNVKKETWQTIREQCGYAGPKGGCSARVVGVWHEGVAPDVVRVADEHADCVDVNLFLDTKDQFLKYTQRPEKCLGLFDPRDPDEFKPGEKQINVLFNGTLVDREIRMLGYLALMTPRMIDPNATVGIGVTKIGGRRELFIPQDDMVRMLGQAKICVNFSDAGPFRHYKGRVAEAAMCGAMLMELANDETPTVLTPWRDYVPFDLRPEDPSSMRQFAQMVRHYLTNDRERERIAQSGRQAALEMLDGRWFWKSLLERLGIEDGDDKKRDNGATGTGGA